MERRLADIPTEEWGDVPVDITPREYVLDYLAHGFPTQLYRGVHRQRRQPLVPARATATASPCNAAKPWNGATA